MRAGRAEQGGQAQLGGHGMHGGDVAVRQRAGDGHRVAGRDQMLSLETGVDQVDHVARQRGQAGHGLVLDRAAVAVGAAQVGRGVVPAAALLVDIPGLADSDYVNFPASLRHMQIIAAIPCIVRRRHARYSDYTPWLDMTRTAAQGATLTESYGNFGLGVVAGLVLFERPSGGLFGVMVVAAAGHVVVKSTHLFAEVCPRRRTSAPPRADDAGIGSPPHQAEDGAPARQAYRADDGGRTAPRTRTSSPPHRGRRWAPARNGGPRTGTGPEDTHQAPGHAPGRGPAPARHRTGPEDAHRAEDPHRAPADGHRPGRRSEPPTRRRPGDRAEDPHQLAATAPGRGRAPGPTMGTS